MAFSPLKAAKHLGHYSGWTLSNLEMQKILYLAHMFYMGENEGRPLIDREFEAWMYGPVLSDLYHEVKAFGAKPVPDIFYRQKLEHDRPEAQMIAKAAKVLGHLGGAKLVAMTHREGGGWDKTFDPKYEGLKISNDLVLEEYNSWQRQESSKDAAR